MWLLRTLTGVADVADVHYLALAHSSVVNTPTFVVALGGAVELLRKETV